MVFQVVFILLFFVLMLIVNKKWKKDLDDLRNPIEIQAKIVLTNPIAATIVTGVLISAFFYEALIPAFSEMLVFLILIATVYLLPKLTHRKFQLFLALIFLVSLSHTFEAYLGPQGNLVRWLILIDAVILTIAFTIARKTMIQYPEQFVQISRLFRSLSRFYIFILLLSVLANIVGMVGLSSLLVTGILLSTILGMVVYLTVKIITSLFFLFFKFRKSSNMQTLSTMINATNQRIRPILNWVGLLVWLMFTLIAFDLFDLILNWFNELMIIHWEIGEMTISLGGILSFIGIFIVSLIVAKIAASIFQDEWMANVLPRGIAPAISLVLRIVIVGVGIYMASTAAGIDLTNLGFMFGALGVGIGFGLQNVVLNFVAGLILAFERPINLGDTILVDQEMGIVTNIGVRSSNIKSYSGYEAIIPNGDLISKKVINYTLANRNRRSKILMKTAPSADPEKVIELFNKMAASDPRTHKDPAPKTYFYGYDPEGNLSFALLYWTTFSDTLKTDSAIALKIFAALKEEGIQAPAPVRRIIDGK
jgi:small-conductance mechanosensitive channel